jgi:O-antigen ligase
MSVVSPDRTLSWTRGLSLAAVAWGALAFGAVYPWAYWPLALACATTGLLGLFARAAAPRAILKTPAIALVVFAAAVLLQLVPVPVQVLSRISPAASPTLRAYSISFAGGLEHRHALSIEPAATWTALGLFVAFAVLLLGTTRALSITGARRLVEGITILGVVLALVGIIQSPLFAGRIYGFWIPQMSGAMPFGPFVNRNHFAGWMLMGLPLALGLLCAAMVKGMRGVRRGWRHKLLWLASPDASRLILIAGAALVMALSLALTLSRSGISAMAFSLLLAGWFVTRSLQSSRRKTVAIVYLLLLAVAVAGGVGTDTIAKRFSTTAEQFEDRRGAWEDAATIASAFPVVGTGLGTYGVATLQYQRHELTNHYDQAHNDYLQLLAEGGVLLTIPAGLLIGALTLATRQRARETVVGSTAYWLRAGAITALIAIALQESVDFSLQIPGNAALFVVVCAIAMHRAPSAHGGQFARSTAPRT